jgi:hypothetical protein
MIGETLVAAAIVVGLAVKVHSDYFRFAARRRAMERQRIRRVAQDDDGTFTGHVGVLSVRMASGRSPDGRSGLWISVTNPRAALDGLSVCTRSGAREEAAEPLIGDRVFDAELYVRGSLALVRARMNAETRAVLLDAHGELQVGDVLEAREDVVQAHLRERPEETDVLARVLGALLHAAQKIRYTTRPRPIVAALVASARSDREPEVRLECLRVLHQEFGPHPMTAKALERGCTDASPRVRLLAAAARGAAATSVLLALVGDPTVGDVCAAGAVRALGLRWPLAEAVAEFARACGRKWPETAHACLDRMAAGGDEAIAPLIAALESARGELAVHATRALADVGSKAAEAPLIVALDRTSDVRMAAAAALARCGTVEAVLPLQQAEARYDERAFHQAAREAVAAIQSRLSGVDRGELSLADGAAGHLSFPAQEGGEVSLAEEKNRRDE